MPSVAQDTRTIIVIPSSAETISVYRKLFLPTSANILWSFIFIQECVSSALNTSSTRKPLGLKSHANCQVEKSLSFYMFLLLLWHHQLFKLVPAYNLRTFHELSYPTKFNEVLDQLVCVRVSHIGVDVLSDFVATRKTAKRLNTAPLNVTPASCFRLNSLSIFSCSPFTHTIPLRPRPFRDLQKCLGNLFLLCFTKWKIECFEYLSCPTVNVALSLRYVLAFCSFFL